MLGKQYGKATSMGYKHQLYTILEEKVFFSARKSCLEQINNFLSNTKNC